jgi:hypothetical protein
MLQAQIQALLAGQPIAFNALTQANPLIANPNYFFLPQLTREPEMPKTEHN